MGPVVYKLICPTNFETKDNYFYKSDPNQPIIARDHRYIPPTSCKTAPAVAVGVVPRKYSALVPRLVKMSQAATFV